MADKKRKMPKLTVPGEDLDGELQKVVDALDDMVEDFGEQHPSSEEDALLTTIYDRLEIFEQANRGEHEEAANCRKILRMDDPDQDTFFERKKNGKKTLQLHTLKSTFNNVVADQMLSVPEAKLMPETADKQQAADDLQDLVHYEIFVANDYEEVHHRRCEDFYGPGTAITQVAWDPDMAYGKGDIAIIRWPIEAFVWDPLADNLQDCRAVMKVSWHPLSWYLEHWPEDGKYVQSDENSYNNVGMSEEQAEAKQGSDEDRALLVEYWWRTYNAETRRYTINVAYAAGHALLEVHTDVYAHGRYPFVIDAHDKKEGSIAGDGLVRQLAPMMRYINRYAAYADMNARMSSKGRMLVQRGSGIDQDALTDWETDIVEGDRIEQGVAWNWMQNQPFNSTITNLMTMFQSDLKADSGANQFTRGETTGGIVSGKAINSLIQAGGKISSMRTEQLKYGDKEVVEQVLWLMAQFLDDNRVFLITGRNGVKRELKVNTKELFGEKLNGAVNPPPYTVQIEISSRDPQRIANTNQLFIEAYQMAAQTPYPIRLSSLLKIVNIEGKDRILPLIEADEKYVEQMQAMQQQLDQMSQQMEQMTAQNENLKASNAEMANTVATMSARKGAPPETTALNGQETPNAIAESARNTFGMQTGAPLPT